MNINSRIFERLSDMKMSQKELSKETGIAESTISEWKSKNNTPSAEKIPIISRVLNVSNDWLLTGEDMVDNDVEFLIDIYRNSSEESKNRLLGYAQAVADGHILK